MQPGTHCTIFNRVRQLFLVEWLLCEIWMLSHAYSEREAETKSGQSQFVSGSVAIIFECTKCLVNKFWNFKQILSPWNCQFGSLLFVSFLLHTRPLFLHFCLSICLCVYSFAPSTNITLLDYIHCVLPIYPIFIPFGHYGTIV